MGLIRHLIRVRDMLFDTIHVDGPLNDSTALSAQINSVMIHM